MSDPSGTAAQPAGGQPTAAQPGPASSNFVQVDPQEYQRLTRAAQQYEGSRAFYERARQHGFDKPEAFDAYGKSMAALNKRGIKLDQLATAFDDPEPQAQPAVDVDEIVSRASQSAIEAAEKRIREADSMREHKSALTAMEKAIADAVDDVVGKGASEYERSTAEAYLFRQVDKARRAEANLYPADHPLHNYDWRAYGPDQIKGIAAEAKKARDKALGAQAASKGAAVNRPAGTAAGDAAAQGKPQNQSNRQNNGLPAREVVLERLAKRQALRGGGTVSSVG